MLGWIRASHARGAGITAAVAAFAAVAAAAAADYPSRPDLERELAAQRAHADRVLVAMEASYASDLARAGAIAKAGTAAQASMLGISSVVATPGPVHVKPSHALAALMGRYGVAPGATESRALRQLDLLADPVRGSLTRFVDAFSAFEAATRTAHASADPAAIATLRNVAADSDPAAAWRAVAPPGATPWEALADAGVALGPILAARTALTDAALGLDAALAVPTAPASTPPPTVNLCPLFAIDLAGAASRYATDCALIIDVGGNDVYRNNAGGAPAGARMGTVDVITTAAAVADFAGNDRYGNPLRPRGQGVNGGAVALFVPMTAGFLLDAAGIDYYVASSYGVNGGGSAGGLGYLVDAGGSDRYSGQTSGVNGGGNVFGTGLLVDVGGVNVLTGSSGGANGGGALGVGTLLAAGGNDTYTVGSGNGGAFLGRGLLVDRGGNDTYRGLAGGVNGGGSAGVGLLLDQSGRDRYSDRDRTPETGPCSGTGTDRTVVPKCLVGAQVDVP